MSLVKEMQITFLVPSSMPEPKFKPSQVVALVDKEKHPYHWQEYIISTPIPSYKRDVFYGWCYLYEKTPGTPELSQVSEDDLLFLEDYRDLLQQAINAQSITLSQVAYLVINYSSTAPEIDFRSMARALADARQVVPTDNLEIAKAFWELRSRTNKSASRTLSLPKS